MIKFTFYTIFCWTNQASLVNDECIFNKFRYNKSSSLRNNDLLFLLFLALDPDSSRVIIIIMKKWSQNYIRHDLSTHSLSLWNAGGPFARFDFLSSLLHSMCFALASLRRIDLKNHFIGLFCEIS